MMGIIHVRHNRSFKLSGIGSSPSSASLLLPPIYLWSATLTLRCNVSKTKQKNTQNPKTVLNFTRWREGNGLFLTRLSLQGLPWHSHCYIYPRDVIHRTTKWRCLEKKDSESGDGSGTTEFRCKTLFIPTVQVGQLSRIRTVITSDNVHAGNICWCTSPAVNNR
jgi:hypothetical protein